MHINHHPVHNQDWKEGWSTDVIINPSSSPSGAKCCSSSIRGSLTQQAMEHGIVRKEFERSRSLSTRQFYQLLSPNRGLHFADTYITLSHSGSDVPLATKTQWKHIYVAGTGNQDEMVRLPSSTKGPLSLRIYVCCLCGDGSCWAINDVIAHNICGVALYLLCQHPIVLQIYAHYDDMINHWPRKNFTFVCEHFLPRYKIRT